jgi:hypothetical protein
MVVRHPLLVWLHAEPADWPWRNSTIARFAVMAQPHEAVAIAPHASGKGANINPDIRLRLSRRAIGASQMSDPAAP